MNWLDLCEKLVKYGFVTLEFKRVVGINPLVIQQFGYVHLAAPLLDLVAISTEFCGAISTQFCFTTIHWGGVTAMPRRLHARLCQRFLVDTFLHCVPKKQSQHF